MKVLIEVLLTIIPILLMYVASIKSDCNKCQGRNNIACHGEKHYSLCIDGKPTGDNIMCPENFVCTSERHICYPVSMATPSCVKDKNQCGVCNENKVYACLNETTIAFCYGTDEPFKEEDKSYCMEGTVCDINSKNGFCTEKHLTKPTCTNSESVVEHNKEITTTTYDPSMISITKAKETATLMTESTATTIEMNSTTNTPTTIEVTTVKSTTVETITDSPEIVTTTELNQTEATESVPLTVKPTVPYVPHTPDEICKNKNSTGFTSSDDSSCRTFILCHSSGKKLIGIKKSCTEGQYFPPGGKYCSTSKPDVCV